MSHTSLIRIDHEMDQHGPVSVVKKLGAPDAVLARIPQEDLPDVICELYWKCPDHVKQLVMERL